MRKNVNKLATLALSGVMVMSMAMPAFAFPANELTVKFTKKLYVDGETLAPQTKFNFKIEPAAGGTSWKYETTLPSGAKSTDTVVTKAGITDGVTVAAPATFAPTTSPDNVFKDAEETIGTKTYPYFKSDATFKIDETKFATADYGTYEYNLKEVDDDYEGVNYSTSEFKLYVMKYHTNESGHEVDHLITKVVRSKAANTTLPEAKQGIGNKVTEITNNYGNPTPPDTPDTPPEKPEKPNDSTHVVHIAKHITGNGSKATQKFKFQVSVFPASSKAVTTGKREQYAVIKEGAENVTSHYIEASLDSDTGNSTSNQRIVEFDAAEGQGIKITGLTKGDKVVVKEIDSDTSYTVTAGEDKTNYATTGSLTTDSRINKNTIDVSANRELDFNVLHNEAKVVVTNTKNNVTPTGIVMSVAPYALMLAVAGGLGVVFFNRKKDEE